MNTTLHNWAQETAIKARVLIGIVDDDTLPAPTWFERIAPLAFPVFLALAGAMLWAATCLFPSLP